MDELECFSTSSMIKTTLRTAFAIAVVTYYHVFTAPDCNECDEEIKPFDSPGSLIFLWCIVLWLSFIPLVPKNMCIPRNLRYLYDVFAIVVFSEVLLNIFWNEIARFANLTGGVIRSFLGRWGIYPCWIPDVVSPSDFLALVLFTLVLKSNGFFDAANAVIRGRPYMSVERQCRSCPVSDSRRRRPLHSF